jgi:hypothetical protein
MPIFQKGDWRILLIKKQNKTPKTDQARKRKKDLLLFKFSDLTWPHHPEALKSNSEFFALPHTYPLIKGFQGLTHMPTDSQAFGESFQYEREQNKKEEET